MKKVPKVLQEEMTDCGAACLAAILKYYHGSIGYDKLKKMTNHQGTGTTAFQLLKVGQKLGFLVEGKRGSVKEIVPSDYPCIAHIKKENYYHFVVLMGIDTKTKTVFFMDPSKGYDKVSFALWEEVCTGNYLFLKAGNHLTKEKSASFWLSFLKEFPWKKRFFLLFLFEMFLSSFSLIGIFETKIYFSYLFVKEDQLNNVHFFLFFFGIHLFIEWGFFLVRWIFIKRNNQLFFQVQEHFIKKLSLLPYVFFQTCQNSHFLSLIESLEEFVSYCLEWGRVLFLDLPILLLGGVYFAFTFPTFFLEMLFLILLFFFLFLFYYKWNERNIQHFFKQKEKRNEVLLDTFSKVDILKGLHQEKYFQKRLGKDSYSYSEAKYRLDLSSQQLYLVQKIGRFLFQDAFLFFFLEATWRKKVPLYNYFSLSLFFNLFLESIMKLFSLFLLLPKVKEMGKKLSSIFLAPKELFPSRSCLPFSKITKLEVKNWSYQLGDKPLFEHLSFSVNAKEKVLFHGKSGSGKSTLFKCLTGYYPIQKQHIYFNQLDLLYINLEDLRSRICYISQEEGLFHGSLLENITLGKKVSKECLQKVLSLTHVDQLLQEKHLQIDETISTLLTPLSGGERKKILLARSLLLKRDVYLFDEVFESMEEEEAIVLMQNVFSYLKDKIVLVISHRKEVDFLFHKVIDLEEVK